MKRAIIIVLDSVGIGALPDAAKYGDAGSNTLVNIKKAYPRLHLPNLCKLGLSSIDGENISTLGDTADVVGCYGKMNEASNGKDTTTGHWEIGGIVTENPFPTFTETGFPQSIIDKFEAAIGRKTLANYAASGTVIINELGDEHMKTGFPIVYTSADSVFQVAAHEDIISVDELYDMCQKARDILCGDFAVARVIARPFTGSNGNYTRTNHRRDFSLAPTSDTVLDIIKENGLSVVAIGKIEDIFEHRGITETDHTTTNAHGIEKTIEYLKRDFSGLIFTNLVDYDMIYGHRNDVSGYAEALMDFDRKLPEILQALNDDDILFITADHGCDPTTSSTDHSREYVPIIVYGKELRHGINLGIRSTFSDVAVTICAFLGIKNKFPGESFLEKIVK